MKRCIICGREFVPIIDLGILDVGICPECGSGVAKFVSDLASLIADLLDLLSRSQKDS